jgi:hypothetical protein
MRSAGMIFAVAFCMALTQGARAQQCRDCKWSPVVSSAARGTVDLYGPLASKDDCERLIAQAPRPDPAEDLIVECVEDSRLEAWYREHHLDSGPSK